MVRTLERTVNGTWLYSNLMTILLKACLDSLQNENSFQRLHSFLMDKPNDLTLILCVNIKLQPSTHFRQNNACIMLEAT